MRIDKEMFEEWLANPVTEHVLAKVKETAEANKAQWIATSWESGIANQQQLTELKARYEAGLDLSELRFEDIDDEHERNTADRVPGADRAG